MMKSESSGNVDAGGRRWRNAGVGGKQLDGDGEPGEQAAGTRVAAVGDAAAGNGDHQVEAFGGDAVAAGIQQSSIAGADSSERQFGTLVAAPCCSARCWFESFLPPCALPSSPPLTPGLKSFVAGSLSLGCWPGYLRVLGSLQWDSLLRMIGFASGLTPQSHFCFLLQSSWHRSLCLEPSLSSSTCEDWRS